VHSSTVGVSAEEGAAAGLEAQGKRLGLHGDIAAKGPGERPSPEPQDLPRNLSAPERPGRSSSHRWDNACGLRGRGKMMLTASQCN